MSDIYVYFSVNFNVFFKLKKVHMLISELYIHQNARCNDKKSTQDCCIANFMKLSNSKTRAITVTRKTNVLFALIKYVTWYNPVRTLSKTWMYNWIQPCVSGHI
jgi:hypothetical protein